MPLLALLPACSGGPSELSSLTTGSIALPTAAPASMTVAMSVTDAYSRIARGALGCWFGATGALKKSHIFHADLDPPERGGRGEVIVHERDTEAPKPWGRRALRIALVPREAHADVEIENMRFPDPVLHRLKSDVSRWLKGAEDCDAADLVAPPPPVAKAAVKKATKKVAKGSAQ